MTRLWFIEFYLKICNICEIVEVKKIVEEVTNYLDGIQHTAKIKILSLPEIHLQLDSQ